MDEFFGRHTDQTQGGGVGLDNPAAGLVHEQDTTLHGVQDRGDAATFIFDQDLVAVALAREKKKIAKRIATSTPAMAASKPSALKAGPVTSFHQRRRLTDPASSPA